MMKSALSQSIATEAFLRKILETRTVGGMEALLAELPIVSENEVPIDLAGATNAWRPGYFHWLPVGMDRGNAGRIKLANNPINPMAERIVNGMEALIELHRIKELAADPGAPMPESPRAAVRRYFGLPPLDELPRITEAEERRRLWDTARNTARKLRIRLVAGRHKGQPSFTVMIEDDGIGQSPDRVHATLLSLGSTTKGDKPYMIGLFGQGGSSAYAVSQYSWVLSRRAIFALDECDGGLGWSVIKQVFPKGRRDPYFAYLAAEPDGRVLAFSPDVADRANISHGTRFAHIGYDFQRAGGSSVTRNLFPALNHVLYNPMLPYELYAARDTADPMWGNAYRLSNIKVRDATRPPFDKTFPPQVVPATR